MDELENIDGYVSKDNLYRLLSNFRISHALTGEEKDLIREITIAIKDMPNEIDDMLRGGNNDCT